MKVLIVDDHPVVRHGIRTILAEDPAIQVCGEASDAAGALESIRALSPDIVILDLNLPDQNGFYVVSEAQRHWPELPILIMSIQPEEHMAVRALKAGARGFLNKESAPEDLVRAVRQIMRGKRYISTQLAEWLALDASSRRDTLPHERLSDREYQVLCMLAGGRSISEIAAQLNRSANTISTYRARILRKMGIDNNAGLTQYALSQRLIE